MVGITDFLRNNSSAFLQGGIGLLGGKTSQEQVAGGLQGFGNAMQANKTIKFLEATNPELAQAVKSGALSGGDAYKMYYQQKLEAQKPKNNLMAVGKNLYDTQSRTWVAPPAGMSGADDDEWGLNPVWGKNAEGKTVLGQLSKSGKFKPLDTGDFSPTPVLQSIDTGTSVISRNSRTGEDVVVTPKNIAEKQRLEEVGTAQGKAEASAPQDFQAGQNALDLVQTIRNDPYKGRGTGLSSMGNAIPGTGGYDFQNKVDQAKSGAFLTAIQQMRGLGALSNSEGGAATAAVARMNTSTSEEEFNAALDDYEKIVRQGMTRAQSKMGGAAPAQPKAGATSSGVKWSIEP